MHVRRHSCACNNNMLRVMPWFVNDGVDERSTVGDICNYNVQQALIWVVQQGCFAKELKKDTQKK